MASGASKLENELVAFIEGHPETFGPQDVVDLRRTIIVSFALMEGIHNESKPGVGNLASIILEKMSEKISDKPINTSQDVTFTLTQFDLCGDFVNRFLIQLCNTMPRLRSGSGFSSGYPEPSQVCMEMGTSLHMGSGHIWKLVNRTINDYHVKVLKLWADALFHEGKITQQAIDETRTAGYDVKYNQFWEKTKSPDGLKSNLDESILLEYLTLVHVATPTQMLAHPGQVSYYVFAIISQFVPLEMVNGTPDIPAIPQSDKHNSKLNTIHLMCNVVAKPYQSTPDFVQSPVPAYLSSDVLDQCVQSVGRFPTTEEFRNMNTHMIEKAAAFAVPPPSAACPLASAPLLSELDGGKKTKRRMSKKRNHSKKNRHHRR
jgi:hypothetical protein